MSTELSGLTEATIEEAQQRGLATDHRALGPLPCAVQLNLLRDESGKVSEQAIQQVRGRGRRPGSRNKRNRIIAKYIIEKFGDPMDALGNIAAMPLADLCVLLREAQGGETKAKPIRAIDALNLQVRVLQDLNTYVHGRQPIAVNTTQKTDAVVIIPGINAPNNVPQEELQAAINARGLDAIDFENMQLLPAPEDAEWDDIDGDLDDDDIDDPDDAHDGEVAP